MLESAATPTFLSALNGSRFSTYLIEGSAGSGDCCVNGAAAHLVELGDKLILCAYAGVDEEDVPSHRPKVILVTQENRSEPSVAALLSPPLSEYLDE